MILIFLIESIILKIENNHSMLWEGASLKVACE
jgi:hypothetical protein